MHQSRRSFLGLGIKGVADSAGADALAARQVPARLVPGLATARCNGCDACVTLCAAGALTLRRDAAGYGYQLEIGRCTGCGECADACDVGALTMGSAGSAGGWLVPLTEHSCRRCGAGFHLPAAEARAHDLCRICERKPSNLFQVR